MEPNTDPNAVPETTAANPLLGAPSLDADRPSADVLSALDADLDEAYKAAGETPEPETVLDRSFENIDQTPSPEELAAAEQAKKDADAAAAQAAVAAEAARASAPPPVELDPEIAAIEQPPHLSEANQSNWKKLQEAASTAKKEAAAKAAEAAELSRQLEEAKKAPAQVPPDYEELKKRTYILDTENDPEFKKKFDEPLADATNAVYDILKKNGATDEVIESIKRVGGPDKVSREWWDRNALGRLEIAEAKRIENSLAKISELKDGRKKELDNAATERPKILEAREKQSLEQFQEAEKVINAYLGEVTEKLPFLKKKEIPADAAPAVKEQLTKHNSEVDALHARFQQALWPTTPQARAEVATAAAASHVLANTLRITQGQLAAKEAEITKLTAELAKIKVAGRAPVPGAHTPNVVKSASVTDKMRMKNSDAVDAGLAEAEAEL